MAHKICGLAWRNLCLLVQSVASERVDCRSELEGLQEHFMMLWQVTTTCSLFAGLGVTIRNSSLFCYGATQPPLRTCVFAAIWIPSQPPVLADLGLQSSSRSFPIGHVRLRPLPRKSIHQIFSSGISSLLISSSVQHISTQFLHYGRSRYWPVRVREVGR